MNAIETIGLSFRYSGEKINILEDISQTLGLGEAVSVLGASGCGKSTLCYCLTGIIPNIWKGTLEGEVKILGNPISRMRLPEISTMAGMVFQDPDTQLFSPTVEDEIAFGPENLCLEREEIGRRIDMGLALTGLEKYRYSHPENLSGGEKQLVAIASVLALEPKIIILDESLSQIDSQGRARIKETVNRLKGEGRTIVMVEHDIDNLDIADRIFFMDSGKLEEIKTRSLEDIVDIYKVR